MEEIQDKNISLIKDIVSNNNSLNSKYDQIYILYKDKIPPPDTSDLPPSIATKINDLPIDDRRDVLLNAGDDLKKDRTKDGEQSSIIYWLNTLRKNYFERTKTYLISDKINTQAYLYSKLEEEISEICRKKNLDVMAGRIAWAFLDTNALKGINDVFGHDKGNLVIRKIARRLKALGTIKLSSGVKIQIQCAIQSGDEYNLFLKSNSDLLPHLKEITKLIQDELISTKTTGIVDLNTKSLEDIDNIKNNLNMNNVDLDDKSQENKFILSASCGIATLDEVLNEILIKQTDTFTTVFGKIKSNLENKAENRAVRGKKELKEKIAEMNPLMKYLLSFRK